jgi:putative membrane protein
MLVPAMFGTQVPLRWPLEPSVLVGTILLTAVYLGAATRWRSRFPDSRPIPPGRIVAFLLAMATLLLALQTPIADLSDNYLFSAHMIEHMLITLAFPPLLLAGVPGWMLRPLFVRFPVLSTIGRALTHPVVAYGLFNAIFLGYHLPTFYDLSLTAPLAHIAFHQLFIATALITWWPVLSPLRELPPLPPPAQMLYLFAHTLPTGLLGALFTFAEAPIYQRYADAPRVWSAWSPLADQQLGGLIMWVIGGTFFLGAFASVFLRWSLAAEAKDRRRYRTT